jgi:geranylgeranyl diphosphate synthase type II
MQTTMLYTKGDFSEMKSEFERCQALIEEKLSECFFEFEKVRYETLLEAMRYSLLGGGKRIRAVLCLQFCKAAGGDINKALESACALEMLHAYTLIHDDLPCMDNDDFRRGKPSNHIKYDVFTATLAGDALQAAAFETLLKSNLPSETVVEMGKVFAEAVGPHGICAGQYLDISGEGKSHTEAELIEIHSLKTSALISASSKLGVLAAGGTTEQITAAEKYSKALGLAFQVRDDLLDITSTREELGKPIGSDSEEGKTTFASIYGAAKCNQIIKDETQKAIEAVSGGVFEDSHFLIWLAEMLENRKS